MRTTDKSWRKIRCLLESQTEKDQEGVGLRMTNNLEIRNVKDALLLMNDREVEEFTNRGLTAAWLRKERGTGNGPKHLRIGTKILYRPEDILKFLEAHECD